MIIQISIILERITTEGVLRMVWMERMTMKLKHFGVRIELMIFVVPFVKTTLLKKLEQITCFISSRR